MKMLLLHPHSLSVEQFLSSLGLIMNEYNNTYNGINDELIDEVMNRLFFSLMLLADRGDGVDARCCCCWYLVDRTVPYRIPTTIINNVLINEKRTEQQNLISNL